VDVGDYLDDLDTETTESGPLCITDLFQKKSVAYIYLIITCLYIFFILFLALYLINVWLESKMTPMTKTSGFKLILSIFSEKIEAQNTNNFKGSLPCTIQYLDDLEIFTSFLNKFFQTEIVSPKKTLRSQKMIRCLKSFWKPSWLNTVRE
jgi:hypothetical protein